MKQNFRIFLLLLPAFIVWKIPAYLLLGQVFSEIEARAFTSILKNVVVVGYAIWLLKKYEIGFEVLGLSKTRNAWLLLLPLLFVAYHFARNWSDWSKPDYHNLLFYIMVFKCVLIGFGEEFLFRGFLQNYLLERRGKPAEILFPILRAALFFGLMHAVNFFDLDIFSLINQMIVGVALGFAFGAFYFKTRNIYPLVLLHAVIDFSAGFKGYIKASPDAPERTYTLLESLSSTLVMCILAGLLFFVGWLILQYRRKDDEQQRSNLRPAGVKPVINQPNLQE
ncbi:MAG: CPBP family intramembrane metalloprotease [Chitinophagaceae bacterium]|nr:MAG: CPBP family intramembrane metalloprotease [Chitinophagaceae bacterium]